MRGTNTVETNMEALPRQKQNCQGQLHGSVDESSYTEAGALSSSPKSSGWQKRPDTCQLFPDFQTQVMACMPHMYIHA